MESVIKDIILYAVIPLIGVIWHGQSKRIDKLESKVSSLLSKEDVVGIVDLAVAKIQLEFERALSPYKQQKDDIDKENITLKTLLNEQKNVISDAFQQITMLKNIVNEIKNKK